MIGHSICHYSTQPEVLTIQWEKTPYMETHSFKYNFLKLFNQGHDQDFFLKNSFQK